MVIDSYSTCRQQHLKGMLKLGSDGWRCVLPKLFSGLPDLLSIALIVQNCGNNQMWDPNNTISTCSSWTV